MKKTSDCLLSRITFILTLSSVFFSFQARAWWDQGHETTARIAEDFLTSNSRAAIKDLLEYSLEKPGSLDLTEKTKNMITVAAVWPDYLKQPLFKR